MPARSGAESAPIGGSCGARLGARVTGGLEGAAAGAGGFGGVTAVGGGCEPNRRTASVTPARAAAVAVSLPVSDVDRISPALRTSAAKSTGWFTAIPLVTASRAACANSATRSATAPPPAELSARNVPASVWARSSRCVALGARSRRASAFTGPPGPPGPSGRPPAGWRAAADDRCDGLDGHHVGLAVHELDEQPGELPEFRALRIGPAALGDLAGGVGDRRRRHLEQLGDRIADAGGGCASRPADRADRLLDSLEEVRQRREIGERGETAERLQRFEDLLQRIMRDRIGAQRPTGAIERARDGRTLPRDERARARVQPNRLRRSDVGRGTTPELFELARQRLGLGGVRLRPARRLAHKDLEVIDRANGDLLRRRVPRAPALAYAAGEPRVRRGRMPRTPWLRARSPAGLP